MNNRSPIDLKQPDMLQKLDKYMKPLIRPFVYKWAITQVKIFFFKCVYSHLDDVDLYLRAAGIINTVS